MIQVLIEKENLVQWWLVYGTIQIHIPNHGLHYAGSVFEAMKEFVMVNLLNPKNTLKDSLMVLKLWIWKYLSHNPKF